MTAHLKKAREILHDAEKKLRSLLAEAAAAGEYETVSRITAMAAETKDLAGKGTLCVAEAPAPYSTHGSSSRRSPRFSYRAGEGVSKSSRTPSGDYVHRVPEYVCNAVFAEVWRTAGGSFTKRELMQACRERGGPEVSSYQAYLVLAFLCDRGILESPKKGAYVLRDGAALKKLSEVPKS